MRASPRNNVNLILATRPVELGSSFSYHSRNLEPYNFEKLVPALSSCSMTGNIHSVNSAKSLTSVSVESLEFVDSGVGMGSPSVDSVSSTRSSSRGPRQSFSASAEQVKNAISRTISNGPQRALAAAVSVVTMSRAGRARRESSRTSTLSARASTQSISATAGGQGTKPTNALPPMAAC